MPYFKQNAISISLLALNCIFILINFFKYLCCRNSCFSYLIFSSLSLLLKFIILYHSKGLSLIITAYHIKMKFLKYCNIFLAAAAQVLAESYIIQVDSSKSLDYYESKYKSYLQSFLASPVGFTYRTFKIGKISGFQGEFEPIFLKQLYEDSEVLSINSEKYLKLDAVQNYSPKHLIRLSQKESLYNKTNTEFFYNPISGIGVDVFVLDSGINKNHVEFTGRVKRLANFVGEKSEFDTVGHGTAIAGVVGSETYGVAKKCNLVDIKVTNNERVTKLSDIISALGLVLEESKKTKRPSLVVLAMSMANNVLFNQIVSEVTNLGIPVITSAGNEGSSSCNYSPSVAPGVLSVGAINDENDKIAPFSNFGACVDVFTSGIDVITTSNKENDIVKVSGTSVSSGIAAGLTAYYMASGLNGLEAVSKIKNTSVTGEVRGLYNKPYTTNKILFIDY